MTEKIPKYVSITNKIRSNMSADFFTGKRDVGDFRQLLKRLKEIKVISSNELKYVISNFRLILLSLGLFHFLPELSEDETQLETIFMICQRILKEQYIRNGRVKDDQEATELLVKKVKTGTLTTTQTFFVGNAQNLFEMLRNSLDDLRSQYTSAVDDSLLKREIPAMLRRFKDDLMALGTFHGVLYDIDTAARHLKSGRLMSIKALKERIDDWEDRCFTLEALQE